MELRHLRYFITVAEELSFSRAAERLQMAQPPLSQQIQALETELGVKLFDRTKRPLQITSAGQAFLEEARLTLEQLKQAVHKTQRIHQGETGSLAVSFTSSIANGVVPEILREFRQAYPDVKLVLREENSAFQLQGLRDRLCDIVFAYEYHEVVETRDLKAMILLQESLVIVLPKNHRLTKQTKISLADLVDEEFVMPLHPVVSGLSEQIYSLCSQAGFVPKVAQEAVYMVTILGLVAGEMGISILPSSVQNLQRQGVVYRPLQTRSVDPQLIAVWRRNHNSVSLQKLLDIMVRPQFIREL